MLGQRGVSFFKVAQRMGHSVQVCQEHYASFQDYDVDIDRI
jgi:hypothetical protein